jgi:hypothetical protein
MFRRDSRSTIDRGPRAASAGLVQHRRKLPGYVMAKTDGWQVTQLSLQILAKLHYTQCTTDGVLECF